MSTARENSNRCRACHLVGGFRCDWIVGDRAAPHPKRCDRPICPDHATQVGPNKHVCPEHREAWEAFRVARREAQEAAECAQKPRPKGAENVL